MRDHRRETPREPSGILIVPRQLTSAEITDLQVRWAAGYIGPDHVPTGSTFVALRDAAKNMGGPMTHHKPHGQLVVALALIVFGLWALTVIWR